MKPKEKAKELFNKYFNVIDKSHPLTDISISAKQYALIAVDEVLDALEEHRWQNRLIIDFYEKVKQEIEQL